MAGPCTSISIIIEGHDLGQRWGTLCSSSSPMRAASWRLLLTALPGPRAISFSLKEEIYYYSPHFMIKIRLYIPSLTTMICIFFLNLLKASRRPSPKNFSMHFPKKNVLQNSIINTPKKILKKFLFIDF